MEVFYMQRSNNGTILLVPKIHDYFTGAKNGDEGVAMAILARILHRVEVVHMNEASYRMKHRQSMFVSESVQN